MDTSTVASAASQGRDRRRSRRVARAAALALVPAVPVATPFAVAGTTVGRGRVWGAEVLADTGDTRRAERASWPRPACRWSPGRADCPPCR